MSASLPVAVIGAGPAGLACALALAALGKAVLLVDERPSAGGRATRIVPWPEANGTAFPVPSAGLAPLVAELATRRAVEFLPGTRLVESREKDGDGLLVLEGPDGPFERRVTALVLATGRTMLPAAPEEDERIWTSARLEEALLAEEPSLPAKAQGDDAYQIVFVQCHGSRSPAWGDPRCCAVGCSVTLKQATILRHRLPEAAITILHNGLRLTRFGEEPLLAAARRAGVHVMTGLPGRIYARKSFRVLQGSDVASGKRLFFEADLVVLARPLVAAPPPHLPPPEDAPPSARPFPRLATGALPHPCLVEEAIARGRSTAMEVHALLGGGSPA